MGIQSAPFQDESVDRLRHELPIFDPTSSQEDQARASLRWLLDQISAAQPPPPCPVDPLTCPNCGRPASSTRSPYCGDDCREEAGFVRQFRAGLTDGTIFATDRQVAFGQILWHLLGGGRPLRRALIADKVLAKVIEKADGKCAACGASAVTIDHLRTACNRPINLRPVCQTCCRITPFGDPGELSNSGALATLADRIAAVEPLRPCDDAASWDWRAYVERRKA